MRAGGRPAVAGFTEGRDGHIDLPRAAKGGFGGGFFAIFVPSPATQEERREEMVNPSYDVPLPEPMDQGEALKVAVAQAALLLELEAQGALRICRSVADIRACFAEGKLAAIMHMEGAEAIDPDFLVLDVLHAAGLRSLGPVWSRPTIFGHGVPFRFPSTGDIGPGLTPKGLELLKICNEKRIVFDMSHLNEAGFWDVAKHSNAPLIATHSNAWEICNHARNLTDPQLEALGASGGMVGLNFACAFLRADGQMKPDVPVEQMIRHLDHMIEKAGEDCVGIGSDYDGAMVPEGIGDVAGLAVLIGAMRAAGYGEALIEKLAHGNWLRVLERTWGA